MGVAKCRFLSIFGRIKSASNFRNTVQWLEKETQKRKVVESGIKQMEELYFECSKEIYIPQLLTIFWDNITRQEEGFVSSWDMDKGTKVRKRDLEL